MLGLSVLAALGGYLWTRAAVERPPAFPLQYAPPPKIGPVQAEYIRTERVPRHGLTATLFHLAEQDLVTLVQVNSKQGEVRGTAGKSRWADVDPVGVAVGSALKVIGTGTEFEAKHTARTGEKLSKARTDMAADVKNWALGDGLMVKRGREGSLQTANILAAVLAVCGFFGWGFATTMAGLPFAVFFVVTIPAWLGGLGTRRTPEGRQLWSQVGGFHRMLCTDSAEARFDFAARKDLYTAYLPFAVAAGAAALRAKKYEMVMGVPAPQPEWYHSSTPSGSRASNRRCHRRSTPTPHRRRPRRRRAAVAAAGAASPAVAGATAEEEGRFMVSFVLVLVLVLAVLALAGFVMGYNKLRAADVRVAEALAGIDVELTRRASLIPSLVHTVQTFAAHEKTILDHVSTARAAVASATAGRSVSQRSAAEKELDTAVGQVLALGQAYPKLNLSANFLDLQRNLADTEDKLAFARQYYNDAVATLNRLTTTIPWMFVAGPAGVSEREYYQTPR